MEWAFQAVLAAGESALNGLFVEPLLLRRQLVVPFGDALSRSRYGQCKSALARDRLRSGRKIAKSFFQRIPSSASRDRFAFHRGQARSYNLYFVIH
jgi:hypothetical protein